MRKQYKLTTEIVKNNIREKYGDKFNLDKLVYINTRTQIIITCPIHGDLHVFYNNLIHTNYECPECAKSKNLNDNKQLFLKRAHEIHGDKYNYDLIDYKNQNDYGVIICPIHGKFKQILSSHLAGKGCPKCSIKYKLTTKEFIEKATKVHNGFYSYDKVIYTGSKDNVLITCPIHGDFFQIAGNHLAGQKCPDCANDLKHDMFIKSTEEFINQAQQIHKNSDGTPKYNYSKTIYTGKSNKVIITCPIHGDFYQRAENHINSKSGCPACIGKRSKAEIEIYEFIKSILKL